MFMLRIRFDTFCTVPVIASSAPIRRAKRISQPPQPCRLLACASRAISVISTSEKRPESPSSCRNRSLRRASRSCSSGRAPLTAPSRLVSINSKPKTATDCLTVGPQLTNNKAHNITRYDGMIMVVYLGQVLALACSFVGPRACAVALFVPRWLRTAQSGRHLALVDALLVARLAAEPLFGGSRRGSAWIWFAWPSARDPSDICATSIIAILLSLQLAGISTRAVSHFRLRLRRRFFARGQSPL